jgi:hypothetical protein
LYDTSIVDAIAATASSAAAIIRNTKAGTRRGVIVLSGCGTSGRMAFLTAKNFNRVLKSQGLPPLFRYTVSGGDPALLLSDELPEVGLHLRLPLCLRLWWLFLCVGAVNAPCAYACAREKTACACVQCV